ncbi:MAG: carbohydrate binding family 9 domain-containing protein [Saprospiraceae bacterium]|nr:carbohydrate binding family 9 domain-containing protein [Saprospiraceae bacterium]
MVLSGQDRPTVPMKAALSEIIIDGVLDEASWELADGSFHRQFPIDTGFATNDSRVYFSYDDDHVYVGLKMYSTSKDYVVTSLKRDFSFRGNDNISILFDTYNDQNNAFLFGMNILGVRREALIANGGSQISDFAASWDNRWSGATQIHDDHWIAEFAIPFKTLRYKAGTEQWRFNSYRWDSEHNEISSWIAVPQNLLIMNLAHMGKMQWDKPLARPGANVSIIPYATAGVSRDFLDPSQQESKWNTAIGGDAKIGLTAGLNLDLTVNPDFSQVEVDEQVSNLDRFELLFPEKRQFFIENADLFGSFGLRRVNPFFSRRIGLAVDSITGQNVQNKIQYGVRLSGKVNERLRVGLLNTQTAQIKQSGVPGINYTVAALEQRVFSRSNIAVMLVNRQITDNENGGPRADRYNRVAGLEYRLNSPDNVWRGKAFYHTLFSPDKPADSYTHGLQLEYLQRHYRLEWAQLFVGNGFDAQAGFVPRRDYFLVSPELQLFFYPRKGNIARHDLNLDSRFFWEVGEKENPVLAPWSNSEWQVEGEWTISFKDNRNLVLGSSYTFVHLLRDFDPTRQQSEGIFLPEDSQYRFLTTQLSYESNDSKKFFYEIGPIFGGFYNGSVFGIDGSITYRYQPYGFVSLDYSFNRIKLADPFVPSTVWLVGPRVDLTLSKKLFFTTFFQYNSQLENLNINARLQYRFAPVSDIFIVYTDNYFIDPFSQFSQRNRALVAKATYWLNL